MADDVQITGDTARQSPIGVGFVLTRSDCMPDPQRVIEHARSLGEELRLVSGDEATLSFDVASGGGLFVTFIPVPHPETASTPRSVLTPTVEDLLTAGAHFIVAVTDRPGSPRDLDAALVRLAAAVVRSTSAVAVVPWPGVGFLDAGAFVDMAMEAVDGASIPTALDIAIEVRATDRERVVLLTRGMVRPGREELLVTTRGAPGDAIEFAFAIGGWLLDDPRVRIPTGDTVGRSATERVRVQRTKHPDDPSTTVVQLDLGS